MRYTRNSTNVIFSYNSSSAKGWNGKELLRNRILGSEGYMEGLRVGVSTGYPVVSL